MAPSASASCDHCNFLYDELDKSHELCDVWHRKFTRLKDSCSRLRCELEFWKSCSLAPCIDCVAMHRKNDELCSLLACARSEHELLEKNLSSSFELLERVKTLSVASHVDLDIARDEIALLHSIASLEHARDEIDEMRSMPSLFSFVDAACQTSCAYNKLLDDDCIHISCTSCIDLENEVKALKLLRDDMSAELVVHKDMSANLEKENDLLHTTYAKCIEEEMENLRNTPCGTCDYLKFQSEVLATSCKSLSAKSFLSSKRSTTLVNKLSSFDIV